MKINLCKNIKKRINKNVMNKTKKMNFNAFRSVKK